MDNMDNMDSYENRESQENKKNPENIKDQEVKSDDPVRDAFVKNSKVEHLLNRDGDLLPFGLFNPETEGKLIWMCNTDQENKITSVFCYDFGDRKEKQCSYLKDISEAIFIRNELIKNNWKKITPPKITFSMSDGTKVELDRKKKRYLARKLKKIAKKDINNQNDQNDQNDQK